MDYIAILKQTLPIVKVASDYISSEFKQLDKLDIEEKEENSFVTHADKHAESILVSGLKDLIPESTFITEEDTVLNNLSDSTWIIDPIDGTTNFMQGIPHFCVSVALQYKGQLVLGIVHDVFKNETFHAIKDGGSFLNGRQINVSDRNQIGEAIIATGFSYDKHARTNTLMTILQYFVFHSRAIRRLGAAALDLAYVAAGRFDAYYESNLNPWDISAGALIVQEAGGKVSDFKNHGSWKEGGPILAANPFLHPIVQQIIADHYLQTSTC